MIYGCEIIIVDKDGEESDPLVAMLREKFAIVVVKSC